MIFLDGADNDEFRPGEVHKHRSAAASLKAGAHNANSHREPTSTMDRSAPDALVNKSCLGHFGRLEHVGSVQNHGGVHDTLEARKIEVSKLRPGSDEREGISISCGGIGICANRELPTMQFYLSRICFGIKCFDRSAFGDQVSDDFNRRRTTQGTGTGFVG